MSRRGRWPGERADQPPGRVGDLLLIALIIPALDAVLPILPSETAIIALGVATAGSTDPRIALLVACAALGAFLATTFYLLGHRFKSRVERRFFASEKGARRRTGPSTTLERFGCGSSWSAASSPAAGRRSR